jgi:hypothetical protein
VNLKEKGEEIQIGLERYLLRIAHSKLQLENIGTLLQTIRHECNELLVRRLLFDLETTCFTHLQKFFKKLVFFVTQKPGMLQ